MASHSQSNYTAHLEFAGTVEIMFSILHVLRMPLSGVSIFDGKIYRIWRFRILPLSFDNDAILQMV